MITRWKSRREGRILAGLLVLAVSVVSACRGRPRLVAYEAHAGPPAPAAPVLATPRPVRRALPPRPTRAEFRNVDFRFDEDLVLRLRTLSGEMRGADGGPVVFDDPESFTMVLDDAESAMDALSMTALMRRYVFGYEGAPIRELEVRPEQGALHQSGVLHKVIDIPFEMWADVTVTDDGWIRIHPTEMKICDLSGLGFMEALGIELEDLLDLEGAPEGIRVEGNDLFLSPLAVLPPPAVRATLTDVRVDGPLMILGFGPPPEDPPHTEAAPRSAMPLQDAPNYMYFSGGVLRFGKLYMPEADMQVVDRSPGDPFDFYLEQYNRQLVAGFTRNRPDYGLEVHMVDYGKLDEGGG